MLPIFLFLFFFLCHYFFWYLPDSNIPPIHMATTTIITIVAGACSNPIFFLCELAVLTSRTVRLVIIFDRVCLYVGGAIYEGCTPAIMKNKKKKNDVTVDRRLWRRRHPLKGVVA